MKCSLILLIFVVLHSAATNKINHENKTEKNTIKGNILCLMGVPSPSHHIWNRTLMKALAKDGYNVTAVSVDVDKELTPNLHYIQLEGVYDELYSGDDQVDLLEMATYGPVQNTALIYEYCNSSFHAVLKARGFKTLFQYPNDFKFDLVIADMTLGPFLLPFMDRFPKAPLMSVSAYYATSFVSDFNGNPLFPSYVPYFALTTPPGMNFFQRSLNLFLFVLDTYHKKKMIATQDVIMRKHFGPEMKYLGSYGEKSEIILINSHPAMQRSEPLLPNVIQVGGLQIKSPAPLPADIEQFISTSVNGAVLFSLGTNMKSEMMGAEKIQMFINAIGRLPKYNFLWKFESDTLPPLPKNVMIKKWLSQNDILAHPKVKLFLSHSGSLSSQEATWHGVPVLAMPFFADQALNAHMMIEDGVAEKLDFFTLTEEKIYNSLKKMLEKPSYALKMKEKSNKFRDRPEHPLELALFWCKYLIRNGHAQHMRSPALEMSHFVQHMWDILLVFVGIVLSVVFVVAKLCCLFRKKTSVKVKKN